MTDKNDKLVIGIFVNEAAAKEVGSAIKEWDEWERKDLKLGAMAVMTIDPETGKLHSHEIGQRKTKKGMGWGTAIGAAVGILSGGIALIPAMIIGGAAGAGLGAMDHKSVGLSDEQHAALVQALKDGHAALAVMCDDFEVQPVIDKIESEGGDVSHYDLPAETVDAISTTADAQAAASEAIDEAVDEVADEAAEVSQAIQAEISDLGQENIDQISRLTAATGMNTFDAVKVHDAGIATASQLMAMAATPEGRKALSDETGVSTEHILNSAKKLDLMRVKGVGVKYATLLLAAGVDTVPELATRNAANLAAKCAEVNKAEQIVVDAPTEAVVADWVSQAKELPRMLYY